VDIRQKDKDVCAGAVNQVAGAARAGIVAPPPADAVSEERSGMTTPPEDESRPHAGRSTAAASSARVPP
jgi:hypothetical protein